MTIKNYFAYLLMFYVASTLIFAIGSNIFITRILNIILIGSFLVYFLNHSSMKLHIHKFLWFYIFFTIFSLLSVFWSIDTTSSINKSFIIIIIAINLVVIYNVSKYFKIEQFILYGLLLGVVFNYAIAFGFMSYSSQYTIHFANRFVGTTNNPNVLAIYMLFSLVASIILLQHVKSKVFLSLLVLNIPLALYVIIMTASKKGAVFGVFLLGIYFLSSLKSRKSFLWSMGIFAGFVFLLNSDVLLNIEGVKLLLHRFELAQLALNSHSNGGSTNERIYLVERAYDVFSKDFKTILFGTGQNTFYLENKLKLYAHNNYMEIITNLGLIGLFLFYTMYYFIINNIRTLKNKAVKYFLFGFIFILLLMDNALVSYTFKPLFFMFIFIVLYTEKDNHYAKN